MEKVKKALNHVFIDGLSGMALGLFATLIIGTIIQQIGNLIGGTVERPLSVWKGSLCHDQCGHRCGRGL